MQRHVVFVLVAFSCALAACPKEQGAAPSSTATEKGAGGEAPTSQPAGATPPGYTVTLPGPDALAPASESDAASVRERLTGSWIATTDGPNGLVISQTLSFVGDGAFTELNAAGDQRREVKGTYTVKKGTPAAFQLELKTATALGGAKIVYSLRDDGTLVAQGGGREFVYQRVQVD